MKKGFFIGWFLLVMVGIAQTARGSHIVGGEFLYTCLNDSDTTKIKYHIVFKLYMDCITGNPNAIAQEDNGEFSIYNQSDTQLVRRFRVARSSKQLVPANFSNECVNDPPNTCLLMNTYEFDVTLPNRIGGYYVATNNCCRNETIINITDPDQTGASYFILLPGRKTMSVPNGLNNNSAVFKELPPQIICMDNPFFYDHSATDADGDSLSYEFGPAFDCRKVFANNTITPVQSPPPYPTVNYAFGFSATNPMNGNPRIDIDPATGTISGTPNQKGRFVVAVYCHEWRNGVMINTIIREFQFLVSNCSKAVVANIPQYSDEFNTYVVDCEKFNIFFENLSTGGFSYHWDFGVAGTESDTSIDFEPTFTYPDTGVYLVKLVVNRGSTCPDSISRFVKVFPFFNADFTYDGLPCPGTPIRFHDTSTSTTRPANAWIWSFGDGDSSLVQNPVHIYQQGGEYNVIFVAKNSRGCADTVGRIVNIERFKPFAGNDTIIVKGESIDFNATGGITYLWTPATNLSNPNIPNPRGYYPDTGRFGYNVYIKSIGGCEGNDSINVLVVNQSAIFVPTAFSPNGDGMNDLLRPIGIGYRNINYFRVFNRWGEQVFYTTQWGEGWDGTISGQPQDIGVYYWVLSITNRTGNEEVVKGDSALIR